MKNYIKILLPIILGVTFGLVLFTLGNAEDAPGLSLIGIVVAFLLIMRGIYHAKIMQKGYHIPIILLVFGIGGIVFPFILLLDGEIELFSIIFIMGIIIGIVLTAFAVICLIRLKNKEKIE